ncbi:MAG: glycosyltransferase [Deltaproteobacteria bacterium]|nr:MAG: glycosyltransferase [Deltaproteobacteria bacterium]
MKSLYPTVTILGSRIHQVSTADIVNLMDKWIIDNGTVGRCHQIIVTGFHGIWEAYLDRELNNIFNSADIWAPDGIAPVLIAKLKGLHYMTRTPGAELMQAFFQIADQKEYRSFFYGDTEKTLAGVKEKLQKEYPGHQIAGLFSPPFRPLSDEEEADIVQMINRARPDVLWVALGLPKQERWIYKNLHRLKVPVAIGVGAAFAFVSGDVKRVPMWIGKNGLEWLWRFIQEPKKLWRRDLIDGPRFLWQVFLELAGAGKQRRR